MAQAQEPSAPAEEKCPRCGSLYEVQMRTMPIRDADSFECAVCSQPMARWNSTSYPEHRLIKQAPWPQRSPLTH